MKKNLIKKSLCVVSALFVVGFSVPQVFAQDSDANAERVLTFEDQKLEWKAEREAKKAERERIAAEKLSAKLEKMTPEQRAEYDAKEAEKKAAEAAKVQAAEEKKAAKEAADAEKQAAKDAALQEKLAAMTPDQKAAFEEKEALKAKLKAEKDEEKAMRKATLEQTARKTDLPYLYLDVDYGLELTKVQRVIIKEGRSNFVFNDTLVGAYCTAKLTGFKFLNPMLKASALMGMGSTFNNMKFTTSTFNWGADLFAGIDGRINFWDYLYLNIAPGFHLLYQDADRFNYLNLGIAGYLSVELPIAYHWTIAVGGQASYDWGNFGNNSLLETYDHVWQAGVNVGIRYSGKHVNKYNYIGDSAELLQLKKDRKNAVKAEKKAKAEAKKAAAAERKAAEKESQ